MFITLQVTIVISENISLKMGITLAVSLKMGKNLC